MPALILSSVELRCDVCGGHDFDSLSSPEVLARHYARRRAFFSAVAASAVKLHPVPEPAMFIHRHSAAIIACRQCGLVLRNPQPTSEAVAAADRAKCPDADHLAGLHEEEFIQCLGVVQRLRRVLPHNARLVEISPRAGGFLSRAGAIGWNACGVGASPVCAAFCRGRALSVTDECIDGAGIAGETVDCVVAWSSFESIRDPFSTLTAAARMLKPGGLFALRIPNGAYYREALDGIFAAEADGDNRRAEMHRSLLMWNDLYGFPYVYGYTVDALDVLFRRHGFERTSTRGDVLPAITELNSGRAALEERWLKARQRARLRGAVFGRARLSSAPWLETTYRLG